MAAALDPALTEKLRSLAAGETLDVVLSLHPVAEENAPEEVSRVAHEVVTRVGQAAGQDAQEIVVYPNMCSFLVRAEQPFLIELLQQPEIASAISNSPAGDAGYEV